MKTFSVIGPNLRLHYHELIVEKELALYLLVDKYSVVVDFGRLQI